MSKQQMHYTTVWCLAAGYHHACNLSVSVQRVREDFSPRYYEAL